uniref:ATP synthase F0 subunit 8 n=1 Tax=Nosodendron fasciculare TaxID=295673 RepID=A0A343C3B7_9COLE|nr:ATP synthase F0 subunit 8 [Nosodendron fasciculare]
MPQMAPLNWMLLFFMFIIIFMLFNSMNYFMFKYSIKKLFKYNKNSILNYWKW